MRRFVGITIVGVLWAGVAAADECSSWMRLSEAEKVAKVEHMIEGHLTSNVGKRYTSENTVAMRRCLHGFVGDLRAEFDGACAPEVQSPMGIIDEIFDRYFLSCVQ